MIAVILVVSLLLRLTGIAFAPYHPDEHLVVNHAMAFGSGDLNPHMFYYPTCFLYQVFFIYGIGYVAAHAAGIFPDATAYLQSFLTEPTPFYTAARCLSAVYGAATVWVVWRLCRENGLKRTAPVCAAAMGIAFLPVRDAHFATVDTALTFFMALSFLWCLRAMRKDSLRDLVIASFIAGLATAVKYNAALLAVPIAVSALFSKKLRAALIPAAAASSVAMSAAFFIGSPFFILDFHRAYPFIDHLRNLNQTFQIGPWHHLSMLGHGMGWAWLFCALAGFFTSTVSLKTRYLAASLLVPYYVMISRMGQPFERYVLPMIPVLLFTAGACIAAAWERARRDGRSRAFLTIVIACLFAGQAVKTAHSELLFMRDDSRVTAGKWILKNVRSGTPMALDMMFYAPALVPSAEQIRKKIADLPPEAPLSSAKARRLEILLTKAAAGPSYPLFYLHESPEGGGYAMLDPLIPYEMQALDRCGARYLVTNDVVMAGHPDFYDRLREDWELAIRIDSRRRGSEVRPEVWTYLPIDAPLWDYVRPGPAVFIFRKIE